MTRLPVIAALLASAVPASAAVPQDLPLLHGPVPSAPVQSWLADKDDSVPKSWAGATGPLHFALSVTIHGNVTECLVEQSSGSPDKDEELCRRLRTRGNFSPAADRAGRPVLGVYRGDTAGPDGAAPAAPVVEMAVGLAKMPRGLSEPTYVDIAASVDWKGKVIGCAPEAGKLLGTTACAEAIKSLKLNPARTVVGRAGPSVQTARVLFTADPATFATAVADPAARLAGAAPAGDGDAIVVTGRQIVGKREATIPYRGFSPIHDYETIGDELILLEAQGGKWYRAKLVAPCIGTESMMPRGNRVPAMAFVTHADGTFDRFSDVLVRGLPPPYQNGRCEIESLVDSAPPKIVKAQMKAEREARIAAAKARKD